MQDTIRLVSCVKWWLYLVTVRRAEWKLLIRIPGGRRWKVLTVFYTVNQSKKKTFQFSKRMQDKIRLVSCVKWWFYSDCGSRWRRCPLRHSRHVSIHSWLLTNGRCWMLTVFYTVNQSINQSKKKKRFNFRNICRTKFVWFRVLNGGCTLLPYGEPNGNSLLGLLVAVVGRF